MNNFEKIKQMTVDEMAMFFFANKNCCNSCVAKFEKCSTKQDCKNNIKKWLESDITNDRY